MTTPTGTIKASDIRNEFGATSGDQNTGPVSLGAYRVSWYAGVYSQLPLDNGIPQGTAAIGFGNFRGKSLNVILDLGTDTEYRVNLKTKYDNSTPTVIGGYKSKPTNTSGKKILISIDNKSIGSDKAATNNVALRTGSWDSGTMLFVRIGTSGEIIGAGGDGGGGGGANNGGNGTSAFGIDYPVTIENYGSISCGFGGGGGGNNASYDNTPPPPPEEPPPSTADG
jgi:hypothetical protein